MKNRSISFLLISAIVLIIGFILSCSTDSPTESGSGGSNTSFDTVTVATIDSTAASTSWIKLTGIPANSDNFYAMVFAGSPLNKDGAVDEAAASTVSDTAYTLILQTDSGNYLITPLNPQDPTEGGEVYIIITDDSSFVSEPIPMTLEPLAAAPGELSAIVALLKQVFDNQLRIAGLTRDDLDYSSSSDIPAAYLPYVFVYDALDSPDNPNSLQAFVDGTAPLLDDPVKDIDLVERLMALTGYKDYLQDYVASLDTVSVFTPELSVHTYANSRQTKSLSPGACISPPDLGITTCAQLAAAMSKQSEMSEAASSAANKVKGDIANASLFLVGLIPGAQATTAMIGSAMFIDAKAAEGQVNLYPSEFVDDATTFDPSVTQFPEDFTQPGAWTEFNVTATSKGWKLDKVVLETILQALSAKGASDEFTKLTPELQAASKEMNETVEGAVKSVKAAQKFNELAGGEDFIQICPNTWSNLNCAGEDYSMVTVSSGPLSVDEAAQTYEPTDIGTAIMRIETNEEFGLEQTGTAVSINTSEIQVFIDPYQAEADTNKHIDFTSRVENAVDQQVLFSLDNGGTMSSDNETAEVTTPATPWEQPLVLHAKSLANTGLREGKVDSDPREDSVLITYKGGGQFAIVPQSICLQPNESQSYSIQALSGTVDSVRWYTIPADVGTISPSGTGMSYTAPSELVGLIDLAAIVNGTDTVYASIDISDCACYWHFNGSSAQSMGLLSTATDYSNLGGWLVVTLRQAKGNSDPPYVNVTLYEFTGIGYYDSLDVQYIDESYGLWAPMDSLVSLPTMQIVDWVENDYMTATVSGEIQKIIPNTEPVQYQRMTFSLDFRAEFTGGVNETICSGN